MATKSKLLAKSAKADMGKFAEGKAEAFLSAYEQQHAHFDWQRMPDSRAARAIIAAQVGDFEFFGLGFHGVIEAKETKHDFRLAKAKVPQYARLVKRAKAGGHCMVLVFHSTIQRWRCVSIKDLEDGAPSWDLSRFTTHEFAYQALNCMPPFATIAKGVCI